MMHEAAPLPPPIDLERQIHAQAIMFATGGYDHTIKLWQTHTGICMKTLQHPDSVSAIVKSSSVI